MINYILFNYKSIAFNQKASGNWNEKILLLTATKTINDLKSENKNIKSLQNLSDDSLITLVALKLLNNFFSENRVEWKFVFQKGKKWLKEANKMDDKKIDEILS